MQTAVALLRGVNVGGHHKIGMDTLRALCLRCGMRDARTFIQSGNVIFRTAAADLDRVGNKLEEAVERIAGFRPRVVLRTVDEFRAVVASNPFAAREGLDPARLAVIFLAGEPGPDSISKALALDAGPEELRIQRRELWIYFPNGMARPKLTAAALEKALGIQGTGRNWNSVNKILAMAEAL